jgi:peroxiredoxin Q/BCP
MASCDDIETNSLFASQNNADFPVLSDPEKSVAEKYGVLMPMGFPHRWTFYIDADGVIVHIDKNVSPTKAGEQIADTLKQLETPSVQ